MAPADFVSTAEPSPRLDKTAPRGMSCAPYVAISIDEDENDPKTANEIMAMPSRRGIWEAWQDWTWSLEVLSLILATASTITVCIILGRWNNQPLQAWPFPIQPNSLISVFSTLAKTALMLPMASVISQMKWIWFEKPRNLAQLQVFDRASRGPWGALNLLWDTRGKAWITKAACVLSVAAMTFQFRTERNSDQKRYGLPLSCEELDFGTLHIKYVCKYVTHPFTYKRLPPTNTGHIRTIGNAEPIIRCLQSTCRNLGAQVYLHSVSVFVGKCRDVRGLLDLLNSTSRGFIISARRRRLVQIVASAKRDPGAAYYRRRSVSRCLLRPVAIDL